MKLRWVEIRKFRHLVASPEAPIRLEFGEGIHLLLGPNGSGKTNLLELLGEISRLGFGRQWEEPVEVSWEMEHDGWVVNASVTIRERSGLNPTASLGSDLVDVARRGWHHRSALDRRLDVRLAADGLVADAWSDGHRCGVDVPFGEGDRVFDGASVSGLLAVVQPTARFRHLLPTLWLPWFESQSVRFEEALEGYGQVTDQPEYSGYIESNIIRFLDGPRTLRVRWAGPVVAVTEAGDDRVDMDRERVAALGRFEALTGLGVAQAELACVQRRNVRDDIVRERWGDPSFRFRLPNGDEIGPQHLSFGQKRLLALLWYLDANPHGPLLLDEPGNGLHHAWLEEIVGMFVGRQVFIATHDPLTIDHAEFTGPDDVQRRIVQCGTSEAGWTWRNLPAEDATDFFEAYEIGIEHVHQILRTKGLW